MADTKATTSEPKPGGQRPLPFLGLPVELQLEIFRHAMLVAYVDVISLENDTMDVSGALVDANFLNVALSCRLAAGVLKEIKRGARQGSLIYPVAAMPANNNGEPDNSRRRHHQQQPPSLDARLERSLGRPDVETILRVPVNNLHLTARFLAAPWARRVRHVALEGYVVDTELSGYPSAAEGLRDLVRGLARSCDDLATVVLAAEAALPARDDDYDDDDYDDGPEAAAVRRCLHMAGCAVVAGAPPLAHQTWLPRLDLFFTLRGKHAPLYRPMRRRGGRRAGVRLLRGREDGGLAVGAFTAPVWVQRPGVWGCTAA